MKNEDGRASGGPGARDAAGKEDGNEGASVVDLVYFDGCPNVDQARESLRAALGAGSWREWDLADDETPDRLRRYGSPTVLVAGRDVTGESPGKAAETQGMACRADGPPSRDLIREALDRHG